MLGDHLGRVLDRVARLLEAACLLEDVGGQHVADVVRPVGQQTLDGPTLGIGVVDPMPLDDVAPRLVERCLVISGSRAALLHGLDEESARVLRAAK